MKKVNILYSNLKIDGNELAFIFPLLFNQSRLRKDYSIDLKFVDDHLDPNIHDCDVLVISSWYFGRKIRAWATDKNIIFEFLRTARERSSRLLWADISDSTGTTQFDVLPYVDRYLKGQVLRDRNEYLRPIYGGRIFSDFYHKNFSINDATPVEPHLNVIPEAKDLEKIFVSWNTGLATYTHLGPYYNVLNYKYFDFKLPLLYPQIWTKPSLKRPVLISCRIGTKYSKETVSFQRKEVKSRLSKICDTTKLSRARYFQELRNSFVSVSPFGLGEISLRDYEIVVSGSLIMKPDCDHMETWPKLFVKNETYIDFKWDFTDFHSKIDNISSGKVELERLAQNAQDRYFKLLRTENGHHEFCARFENLIK